ncbi:MAG: triose-phosphate isomerase [Planctomycetes bacterium]|nr:triose-phosphate isomerase [Planctomycetota bacterium]
MNLKRQGARELAAALARDGRQAWLFPAAVHLVEVAEAIKGGKLQLGAQDVSPDRDGAFTGDLSAEMLADAGASLVLAGHSERRQGHGESSGLIARKLKRALQGGLSPLLCVGETRAEREMGHAAAIVGQQLSVLSELSPTQRTQVAAVAYEPVWAIGTGLNATAKQADEMHREVKSKLKSLGMEKTPVLYGGSVKADNCAELLACPNVDGLLVGGASLTYESLAAIDDAARK